MPWLPMYLAEEDVEVLVSHLDGDDELAWILPDGPGRWRARPASCGSPMSRTALWHVPSGPLPLAVAARPDLSDVISDPWQGWTEQRSAADPTTPWFGPGPLGIYWLNLRVSGEGLVGMSSFEWIGNHYWALESRAGVATQRHWRRLGRWVARNSQRVPRTGSLDGPRPEIYAFPSALEHIRAGRPRAGNPI